jgi:D-tagatose-1,6-bisphosphate aldolase subunit GatZ/KbaZ
MAKATAMVEAYARAGYAKIHLDCSMACAGDPEALGDAIVAERAARLAAAAEAVIAEGAPRPVYVVGTEVPAPGGMGEGHGIMPTAPASVLETWRAHERAFADAGLDDALSRVVAIVVQPGLDFGNEDVVHFEPAGATGLSRSVDDLGTIVFEAHSTDYQAPPAYEALVDMHFAVLKVGPAATFALREAVYALEAIAREMPGWDARRNVRAALEEAMLRSPANWSSHYHGDAAQQAYLRHFSYSDRVRYYWTDPDVETAVTALFRFLGDGPLPLPLVSQYAPQHMHSVIDGSQSPTAAGLVRAKVQFALAPYADACGTHLPSWAEA